MNNTFAVGDRVIIFPDTFMATAGIITEIKPTFKLARVRAMVDNETYLVSQDDICHNQSVEGENQNFLR